MVSACEARASRSSAKRKSAQKRAPVQSALPCSLFGVAVHCAAAPGAQGACRRPLSKTLNRTLMFLSSLVVDLLLMLYLFIIIYFFTCGWWVVGGGSGSGAGGGRGHWVLNMVSLLVHLLGFFFFLAPLEFISTPSTSW